MYILNLHNKRALNRYQRLKNTTDEKIGDLNGQLTSKYANHKKNILVSRGWRR